MSKPAAPAPEHCFVKNPLTGKLINILPLFELMSEQAHTSNGPLDLATRIQVVHDFVSTNPPSQEESQIDPQEWADMSYTLVIFRKTFERMQEMPA